MILEVVGFLSNALLLKKDLHKEESTVVRNLKGEGQMALTSGFGTFDSTGYKFEHPDFMTLQPGNSVRLNLDAESDQISIEHNGSEIGFVSEAYYRFNELKEKLIANNQIKVTCIRKDLNVSGTVSFAFEIR